MLRRYIPLFVLVFVATRAVAQVANIRYVCNNNDAALSGGTTGSVVGYHVKGAYRNDGKSWATAKENIQDAINDLVANKLTGEVWVAEGTYSPTESTESSGGSTLYMAFKIPAGITVRGGFHGLLTATQLASDATKDQIDAAAVAKAGEVQLSDREMNATTSSSVGESTKYRTVLTGSLKDVQEPVFTWNATKGQFDTQFYGNCYHVVTFATNGFDENGRANALIDGGPAAVATELAVKEYVAKLEGFVVMNGNAKNTSLEGHPHNAYGGGVYMVPGSMVENVYFSHCEASRDGGAIYMDGGGIVRHCYIADCQALGVDLTSGYGGGLCADENKQLYPTQVTRTSVVNCVARYGGGMASKVTNTTLCYETPTHNYDMRYNNGFASNLIVGCTATTEGGGAYSYQGGSWTQMTIVNNKCLGSGLIVGGMKTGQSAGMYVRDDAMVANSILWGGVTQGVNDPANKSPQFAVSRSTTKAQINLLYTALNNVDNTNWSGVKKDHIIRLSSYNKYNDVPDAQKGNEVADITYPTFLHPSNVKGWEENAAVLNYLAYDAAKLSGLNGYSYKVSFSSGATNAGVLTKDLDTEDKTPVLSESYDIQGKEFTSFPTLGAYVSEAPSMAPSIEWVSPGQGIAHVYVDPSTTYVEDEQYAGSSWATPIKNLRDAFQQINDKISYLLSEKPYTVTKIQVHVKEGTVDMNGAMAQGSVRGSSLVVPVTKYTKGGVEHNLPIEVLGGYDQSLSFDATEWAKYSAPNTEQYYAAHQLNKRNPVLTPTVITGKVLGDYKYNIAHLLKIEDKQDVTIDGFQLRYANARSQELEATPDYGAALTIKNSTDITIKNVLVAGCTAENGAVASATGSSASFENCIFHNNETTYSETTGNIMCDATSSITLDHCDVLRNVGYAFYTESGGQVTMTNSIVYANMSEPVADTNNKEDKALVAMKGAGTYTGDHNLFDIKSEGQAPMSFMQHTSAHWLEFTFMNGENERYPFFCNSTKNAGVSVSGDDTYYGRATSFQPHNGNPAVNNASSSGDHTTWGTDMSTVITRDYGGRPDIGAIENHRGTEDEGAFAYADGFPAYGTQWYVRDYGSDLSTDGRDGMSWTTAINGNGLYDGIEGLQYAVNIANQAFEAVGEDRTMIDAKEVWVGAGTYSKDNATDETSCFIIRDGVKVYGAFPKTGNPGKEQREVLCSQYVKETNSRTVDNYESILQPKTKTAVKGVTARVLGQPYSSNPVNESPVNYLGAEWDGFTLRNGALDANELKSSQNTARVGGAAAAIYNNVTLRNIVAVNNTTFFSETPSGANLRAGGVYIDGGTLESSYVINNKLEARKSDKADLTVGNGYGGGIFIQQGTVYNSVIANNTIKAKNADGAGTAVYTKAKYFNNTVVYNKAEAGGRKSGGIAMVSERAYDASHPESSTDTLTVYNTISIKNEGFTKGTYDTGYKDFGVQLNGRIEIHNCISENITQKSSNGRYMTFTDCQLVTDDSQLFVAKGSASTDFSTINLRLSDIAQIAVNHGINAPSINGVMYDLETYTDMDNNDRILDCTVDVGAYEYNNSYAITPDLTFKEGQAIYYVTPDGRELASANLPDNAACAAKLQRVLDAAGRYKYQHPEKQVIVKVATRKVGNKTSYVIPGAIAVNGENKDDLNAIKNYKQYLEGLTMVVEDMNGNVTEVNALSGLTCPTNVNQFYVLGTTNVNIYAGKKVTFKYRFPGGTHGRNNTDCIVASVWMDTNGDKVFNKFIGRVGGANRWNDNSIFDAMECEMPEGLTGDPTRIRIRLESSYMINYADANGQTNRMVYDIPVTALNGTSSPASFQYYANRTVDDEDQDIRMWSIIVPRGVEVWGGYSDVFSTATDNGFYNTQTAHTDKRDILGNPVYFDAAYYNKDEGTNAVTYHVLSFTDKLFDGKGNPYHEGDVIGEDAKAANADHALMSMKTATQDRAVVDGIFIQGGQADANAGASTGRVNINQYGGAAIVTDYAHVRNCIVRDNKGLYGGAFALTHGALISGTLIEKNSADYGGAVYVFEDGVKLSDGTEIQTGQEPKDVARMPRIYTSTIVNNKAERQGGGLWFTDDYNNVRVNSTLLWQNQCNDEANVYGDYSPVKADDDKTKAEDFFPFAYSAVQNMRLSGTNNQSVETANAGGIRIAKSTNAATDNTTMADKADLSDFGYWKPTTYSVLLNTGMPVSVYESLITSAGLAVDDFAATDRLVTDQNYRSYVDIGARALMKPRPTGHLMLRLFVAKPEDVDIDAATSMMNLNPLQDGIDATEKSIRTYYRQEGSSFAYPFQSLQDALDYIVWARSVNMQNNAEELKNATKDLDKAVDVPFEIFVAKGEYFPTKDLVGNYGESLANTFAIPEGVSIYGGFDCTASPDPSGGGEMSNTFFGAYSVPKATATHRMGNEPFSLKDNIQNPSEADLGLTSRTLTLGSYKVLLSPTEQITAQRPKTDINKNSIIEPWEFQNQTILSGNTTNENADGVYHVLSVLPDENIVGQLPEVYSYADYNFYLPYKGDGYQPYETGQDVTLNGLTISGGYAEKYESDLDSDPFSEYTYFKGGGIVADGNRYNNSYNEAVKAGTSDTWTKTATTEYKHGNIMNNVAYHNVPITIVNCKLRDNVAGYGGAIASNCEMLIYGSSFENNLARAGSDTFQKRDRSESVTMEYPGQGGAILCSYQFSAYNTLFANNEAQNPRNTLDLQTYKTYNNQSPTEGMLGGAGGALYMGKHGFFHIFNCNFVRNKANAYPAIFTANPNYMTANWMDRSWYNGTTNVCMPGEYNQLENSVLWGNELNEKISYTSAQKFAASLVCNLGRSDRGGAEYSPAFTDGNVPTALALAEDAAKTSGRTWMETAWFCAYEEGRGIPANNKHDMRAVNMDPTMHIVPQMNVSSLGKSEEGYQNSNIVIDSENGTLEGPNFGNPSKIAGVAGYREDSDWSPARLCNLTDNGSGKLTQTDVDGEMKFVPDASGSYAGAGTYWTARYQQINDNSSTLPIGNEPYMKGTSTDLDILRISLDPNPTHDESYIDIGVYEYVHVPLHVTTIGDEVDILWVSTEESFDNGTPDGKTWATPTSDLQRAIETLLASRNNHRKEIRLMEGEYSPVYTINGHQSFYIDTKYLNGSVELPLDDSGNPIETRGVKSFTIKGGYSKDLLNQYDVSLYPTTIKTKKRSNATEDDWDHAIYIADATQRYGINGGSTAYTAANGFGWWETSDKQSSRPAPTTVPIQIDGVTVINNQALPDTKGAAIYYADQTFNANCQQEDGATAYVAQAPTEAHITTAVDTNTPDGVSPDGTVDEAALANHKYATKSAPAKLILSKSQIYDSGAYDRSAGVSAVYVGQYGGEALIYNNVFHSNYGDPLVTYNSQTINNTFALNKGKAVLNNLDSYKSTIFNSAFWKNASNGDQFQLDGFSSASASGDVFRYNAYTGGDTEHIEYGTAAGNAIFDNNYNVGLIDNNTDAIYGPNFANPEDADVTKRSFKLLPSMRLLNRGKNSLYNNAVNPTEAALAGSTNIYDYSWVPATELDAAGSRRFHGISIDLGAYEYQSRQYRVLYVDPNKLVTGANDKGTSWDLAFGYGQIQAAIDLAAIYYKDEALQTYVFVKAASPTNPNMHTGETLTFRNGVSVLGNVDYNYVEDCKHGVLEGTEDFTYEENDLSNYVKQLRLYHRAGIVSPLSGHTRISGINTNGTEFASASIYTHEQAVSAGNEAKANPPVALIDGFDVTAKTTDNPTGAVSEPVINIRPMTGGGIEPAGGLHMAIRNVVVHDNDAAAAGCNIANVNNALLYDVLFHTNKVAGTQAVLNMCSQPQAERAGYAVNCTVEGKTIGADGSTTLNNVSDGSPIRDNTAASHVYNSLTNFDEATRKSLSGYCYAMEDNNLNYQLTEGSRYIDACAVDNTIGGSLPTNLRGFINYQPVVAADKQSYTDGDIDLLGNFRLQTLGNLTAASAGSYVPKVDRGAFETWKVTQDVTCVFPDYPHDGSVEYIMQGNNLVIDPVAETGDNRGTPHYPGFVLVQDGASLYGNGRAIMASYVAVERKIHPSGNIVAMPFEMDYATHAGMTDEMNTTKGVGIPSYDADGCLSFAQDDAATAESYDGSRRSAWDFDFIGTDCWKTLTSVTAACQGVCFHPGATDGWSTEEKADGRLYRFLSRGTYLTDYIYREEIQTNDKHQGKSVLLTQHDDREPTNGGADFTSQEDMGWNCIGIPYLVSNYRPYLTTNADRHLVDGRYMMHVPHNLWLYYDGKVDAEGNKLTPREEGVQGDYYEVGSWTSGAADWHLADGAVPRLWVGEGFFTQTAAVETGETLMFYLPVCPPALALPAPHVTDQRSNTRYYSTRHVEDQQADNALDRDITIRVHHRTITIEGLQGGELITILSASGQTFHSAIADSASYSTTAPTASGIYIISVNNGQCTKKVRVD